MHVAGKSRRTGPVRPTFQALAARQLAQAGVELHHDVGGIEAALSLQVVGEVCQLGAEPVER
jgi:hypothetical protein